MSDVQKVLIYAIRGTDKWWEHVGNNMKPYSSVVVSDIRGKGDFNVVDDFYGELSARQYGLSGGSCILPQDIVEEIIARCRVLRCLDVNLARAMVGAMVVAFEKVLDTVKPVAIISFPIDRYVSDVLQHLAKRRSVPFYELTVSPLPGMAMLTKRGVLMTRTEEVRPGLVEEKLSELTEPFFEPSYVKGAKNFGSLRWVRIFLYFRLRGMIFKLISMLHRDPLNLHYLDAQSFLHHKVRLKDWNLLRLIDHRWREKAEEFEVGKRVFFGLTVFPEASIDYWIDNLELIEYEKIVIEAARAFSNAGFVILVKDHPQQFGFRQKQLVEELLQIENVVLVPYGVSGNEALMLCGTNFTCTGTLGLQAALLGKQSVVIKNYYAAHDSFIFIKSRREISRVPEAVIKKEVSGALKRDQHLIVERLLRGSFSCDFFSFVNFNHNNVNASAAALGRVLGEQIRYHQY